MLHNSILKTIAVSLAFGTAYTAAAPSRKLTFQDQEPLNMPVSDWRPSASDEIVPPGLGSGLMNGAFWKPYQGHELIRVSVPHRKNKKVKKVLDDVLLNTADVDVWKWGEGYVDVRVSPEKKMILSSLIEAIDSSDVTMKTIHPNLQHLVDAETLRLSQSQSQFQSLSDTDRFKPENWFADYHKYKDIVAFYKHLAETYKDFVEFIPSIGKTYLGVDLIGLRITSPKGNKHEKAQFWFHTGDHAREWIGPATVQYFVYQFLSQYGKDPVPTSILDKAEFIIVPLMNADGYEHTWNGARLWRKNRRPIKKDFFGSIGVDLNRNWPAHWGEGGSSNMPFSDVYMGPSPGSEPEVKALMKFLKNENNTRLVGAIDFHSFSQLVLRPYGWTYDNAPDEALLKEVGDGIRDVIEATSGKKYQSIREIDLYKASGTASDWFYDKEVQDWLPDRRLYAYTIELRPAADESWGANGFVLPPDQIVPTGEEIYEAMKYYLEFAIENPLTVKKD
ncbi:hypothetical protein HDV05_001103 [Chytridiales sp. JEL 0842]|nr:hypothetical protein HDV05_001103 [Chytridiales sp. JEL 0842]